MGSYDKINSQKEKFQKQMELLLKLKTSKI